MHEILRNLPPEARVLDVACAGGSFPASSFPFTTIRADLTAPAIPGLFVRADASALPFPNDTFDVVICNHGLEHFENPHRAMQELGRVVKSDGAIFVSVPDARTFHDRLYRLVARGGGHINFFTDPNALAQLLEWYSGLSHVATKPLGASFAFLNGRNVQPGVPLLYWLLARRWEVPVVLLSGAVRWLDRTFGTRAGVYGWGFYLGAVPETVDTRLATNLCMRCGQAHSSEWLEATGSKCRMWLVFDGYQCPGCGATNLFG